jgi:hypothetical protein
VFDNSTSPQCPFCKTPYTKQLPVLNLYSARRKGEFKPDNHRIMVYNNQYLYQWHTDRTIFPNERLKDEFKKPVGYFVFHNNKWLLVNQTLRSLKSVKDDKFIKIGESVELTEGTQLLFSDSESSRLASVQIVN